MVSSGPARKGQLFLMQVWAVAFLHLCNWASPMSAPFYSSPCDRAVVLLTWIFITWEIQAPWVGSTNRKGGGGGWVAEFHALCLASWTQWCSQTHAGVKGMLQQPSTTRNVDVIFSVLWNILVSRRLQGGIQIAPGFNWHTLCLLLVIFLLIFFSFHRFLIDFWYKNPCVCSCEYKGAEIQMLLIEGHNHRRIIYAELVWLFPNDFLLH